jgi:hypothetical protein
LELGSKGDNNRDTVLRGKGGRGGPKPELRQEMSVPTASLASDNMIWTLSKRGLRPRTIAIRTQLPLDHVQSVLSSMYDQEGKREASKFEIRFWTKVSRTDDCWLWTAMTVAGYGRLGVNGKLVGAHQISWRLHRGPIPSGLVICHNCPVSDKPHCVNPDHLFLATQPENMRDAMKKRAARLHLQASQENELS